TVGQPKEGLQKPRRSAPEADPSRGGYGCKAHNMGRTERQPLRVASHGFRSHKTKPLLDKPGHQRPRDQGDRANASKTAHRQQRPSGNNQKSPTPTRGPPPGLSTQARQSSTHSRPESSPRSSQDFCKKLSATLDMPTARAYPPGGGWARLLMGDGDPLPCVQRRMPPTTSAPPHASSVSPK